MRKLLVVLLIYYPINSIAQPPQAITELLASDKGFAAMSVDKSTKVAFIENLADNSILFKRGIVNGKKFWQEAPEGDDKLAWEPQFADISIGGDFGYTTGPFRQFQNRTDTQPAGGGHYVSVWQKLEGKWKIIIDGGVGHPPVDLSGWETSSQIKTVKSSLNGEKIKAEIKALELSLLNNFQQKGASAFFDYLSAEARVYRPTKAPYRKDKIAELVAETDKLFSYEEPLDVQVAPAGDMAFDYGNVGIEITRDGNIRKLKGNYMRIWKMENGKEWKIVVDMILL